MQGWEIPKDLVNINEYLQHISERESWKQTFYVRALIPAKFKNMAAKTF